MGGQEFSCGRTGVPPWEDWSFPMGVLAILHGAQYKGFHVFIRVDTPRYSMLLDCKSVWMEKLSTLNFEL